MLPATTDVRRVEFHAPMQGSLVLTHDGNDDGRFDAAVRALLDDELTGGPQPISVTYETTPDHFERAQGSALSLTETHIRFVDGATVPLSQVVTLTL